MKKIICALFLMFLFSPVFSAAFDINSAEITKLFADDLLLNGFVGEAATEYKKYLFMTGADQSDKEQVVFALADIYKKTGDNSGIVWIGNSFFPRLSDSANEKLAKLLLRTYLNLRDIEDFYKCAEKIPLQNYSEEMQLLIPVSRYVLKKNLSEARAWTENCAELNEIFSPLNDRLVSYKKKSPALASILSALIPGLGKIYNGSYMDGFSVLLSFASFGTATFFTFKNDGVKSWRPWVFAAGTLGIYSLDIYSAAKGAIRHNKARYNEIVDETVKIYDALY